MFAEENIRVISLDTPTRVKGVCQLMDGVIFNIRLTNFNSEKDITSLVQQFNHALLCLDRYISKADLFLEKHRHLNKISDKELKGYQRIVNEKRKEIMRILMNEYVALGLQEYEDFCQRIDPR